MITTKSLTRELKEQGVEVDKKDEKLKHLVSVLDHGSIDEIKELLRQEILIPLLTARGAVEQAFRKGDSEGQSAALNTIEVLLLMNSVLSEQLAQYRPDVQVEQL